jgi:glutathionylspermidine synthase
MEALTEVFVEAGAMAPATAPSEGSEARARVTAAADETGSKPLCSREGADIELVGPGGRHAGFTDGYGAEGVVRRE